MDKLWAESKFTNSSSNHHNWIFSKVQLYPFLGGESDQVDNMRKDGSDNMENKKALDAVNKKLSKNNMPPKIDHGPIDPRSRGQRRDDSVQRRGDVDSKY